MPSLAEKLTQLGYTLPERRQPLGSYVPALRVGAMVYTSGQISGTVPPSARG